MDLTPTKKLIFSFLFLLLVFFVHLSVSMYTALLQSKIITLFFDGLIIPPLYIIIKTIIVKYKEINNIIISIFITVCILFIFTGILAYGALTIMLIILLIIIFEKYR